MNLAIKQKILEKIQEYNRIFLFRHVRNDGDCVGATKGMKALIAAAEKAGVELYFDGVSCFAYNSGLMEGFIPFRDAARFTTREQVVIYPYSVITYQPEDWRDPFYLVQPHYAYRRSHRSGGGTGGSVVLQKILYAP